ncbi:MAG: hypothetical protein RIC80_22910 [Cyclobacteriaceae bacterium]
MDFDQIAVKITFFIVMTLLALVGNVIWYWLKSDLGKRGYETHLLYGHLDDLFNAREVMKVNQDPIVRDQYKRTLNWLTIVFILFIALPIGALIYESKTNKLRAYDKLLNQELTGIVKSKYIDSSNHMNEYLELSREEASTKINVTMYDSLYEKVQIGDNINKLSGDSTIYLNRQGSTILIVLNRNRYFN